jgi:hypothetical protein
MGVYFIIYAILIVGSSLINADGAIDRVLSRKNPAFWAVIGAY